MAGADGIPQTKACKKCGEHKPLTREHWTPQKLGKYGFTSRCRECRKAEFAEARERPDQKARQQAWRDANKAAVKDYNQAYRKAGYKSTAHVAAWRARNLAHSREYERKKRRRLYAADPEKFRAIARRSYYRDHAATLKRVREKSTRRYRTVPWVNLKAKVANRVAQMLRGRKNRRTEALLGYTMKELVAHIERQFTKGMSWEKVLRGEIHIDHIVPVAKFKPASPEDPEFKACWALSNLRPMWASQNCSKGARVLTLL